MKKLLKLFLFLIFFAALIAFQNEAVMPTVFKVIESDLFLDGSDDLGDTIPIENAMTNYANQHCNKYLVEEFGDEFNFTLPEKAINIWNLGSYDYVVNGELTIQPEDGPSFTKKYVCRIQHDGDHPNDFDEWSLYDISGLDDL